MIRDVFDAPAAISRLSAVDTVRARIIVAINTGMLAPGQRLPATEEMAEAFDVSTSSVIRGLRALQDEGVLLRKTGRYGGTFVQEGHPLTVSEEVQSYLDDDHTVHALIEERAVIEAGLSALAATTRDDGHLRDLAILLVDMAETESWAQFRKLDRAFHRLVAEAADSTLALPLFHRVNKALDPYYIPYNMDSLHESNEGHRDILDALQRQDAGQAALVTAAHVRELHHSMYVGLPMKTSQ